MNHYDRQVNWTNIEHRLPQIITHHAYVCSGDLQDGVALAVTPDGKSHDQ